MPTFEMLPKLSTQNRRRALRWMAQAVAEHKYAYLDVNGKVDGEKLGEECMVQLGIGTMNSMHLG